MNDRDESLETLAFEHAPVGIVLTENRIIRACNLTFAQMFRYRREELIDRSFAFLYPSQEEFEKIRDVGVEPLRRSNEYSDERIMARRDGALFWCRVRGHSFTRDNPLARAVWSFADLSAFRPVMQLTTRERQIVMHLGEGRTSKEIARLLDLSPRTVEAHRARLLRKYAASNVAELLGALAGMPQ
jgi:PAS domain S-box-containing protein